MSKGLAQLQKGVGERLRQRRRALERSQEDLAFQADLSPSYLSQIEAGQRNPSLATLYRLSECLKIEVRDLF